MGVNNRQRRKAKKQQRHQDQGSRSHRFRGGPPPHRGPSGAGPVTDQLLRDGVLLAAEAFGSGDASEYPQLFEALRLIDDRVGGGGVHRAVVWWIDRALDRAWEHGWQPADVTRFVRRELGTRHAEAVGPVVAAAGAARPEAARDDRWAAQVAALHDACPADFGALSPAMPLAVEALAVLLVLPTIPRLSAAGRATGRSGPPGSGAMLERVRALLAKAESTTFPEEAEALTTKAQELMARHAIDTVMLDAGRPADGAAVIGWRIGVDDPYAQPKSLLLDRIATANGCSAVWCKELGSSTVFGHRSDLEMVEVLFTSLLVQGTEAMLRAGRSVDRSGRSRTTSFRKSFLAAYALRIGERLAGAAGSAVAEGAERYGDALLPVLTGRADAVDDAVRTAFPRTSTSGAAISNHAGWVAGRAAAELASLGVGGALATG